MFIFNLTYKKPISEVEEFLDAHREYLDKNYESGKFICSGRKNPRTGGIILCNCSGDQEAQEIISKDPFYFNGVAEYDIIEFEPSKYSDAFSKCI